MLDERLLWALCGSFGSRSRSRSPFESVVPELSIMHTPKSRVQLPRKRPRSASISHIKLKCVVTQNFTRGPAPQLSPDCHESRVHHRNIRNKPYISAGLFLHHSVIEPSKRRWGGIVTFKITPESSSRDSQRHPEVRGIKSALGAALLGLWRKRN